MVAPPTYRYPLARPRLPNAACISPYLREIDCANRYTNFGPLSRQFEERSAEHLGVSCEGVVAVANGTSGITLALQTVVKSRKLCLMPSWTFAATPAAAVAAGLVPYFVDVEPHTWALDPMAVQRLLPSLPEPPAAVVPVAPFGAPADAEAWDTFSDSTGIPVVIDSAAAFDGSKAGRNPMVISLHATKVLAAGEGGLVASSDKTIVEGVRLRANFGLSARREAIVTGANAKFSEYAAAVGLAALDGWGQSRRILEGLTDTYTNTLKLVPGLQPSPGTQDGWVSSTCNVLLDTPIATEISPRLAAQGIGTARWWGQGCHRHPAFAKLPRAPLPVTESLAEAVIGLPFYAGLRTEDVEFIVGAVRAAAVGSLRQEAAKEMPLSERTAP